MIVVYTATKIPISSFHFIYILAPFRLVSPLGGFECCGACKTVILN